MGSADCSNFKKDFLLNDLLIKQSVPVEGDETVRCSPMLTDGKIISYLDENCRTLHDVFLRGLKQSNNGPCLGWRPSGDGPYKWLSYQEVLDMAKQFGSGLLANGATADPSQFIGIFSQNRVEWKVAEQACNSYSMVVVTLHDTLGPEAMQHIITQCELKFIVVDKVDKVKVLLSECKNGNIKLDTIITVEEPNDEIKALADETSVKLKSFKEILEDGKNNDKDFVTPKPEDLNTICYTSGTTGMPKGVMLTHANFVANHAGVFGVLAGFSKDDVYISYLPLARVFERLMSVSMFYGGASIGFFRGNVKLLLNDVGVLKPTVFPMVPRLINRIYDRIWSQSSQSPIKKFLLNFATSRKIAKLKKGITTTSTIWDKIVFSKIRALLGGRIRFCITGAAPVSLEVINFMRVALGLPFTEGYGQTESTAGISISVPGDFNSGSVGSPALCNYVKLVDVPEKNYYAKDGKGEICAKGSNIFQGYYKEEEKTKEALDEDGWLHTGDVGMWLPSGALKIIDRKKNIFKISQGEYIAPEMLGGVFVQSMAIAQVFVYGESLKSTLVAVVVPHPDFFETWCSGKGINGSYKELLDNGKVNKMVLDDMCAIGKERGLKGFELVHFLHAHLDKFPKNLSDMSEEHGERFHQDIKAMETRYRGQWDVTMMADYCWCLKRNCENSEAGRKAKKRKFMPNTNKE